MEYSDNSKQQFGLRLQKIRIQKGFKTQTELGDAYKNKFGAIRNRKDKETNSMQRTIQSWETGKSVPPCTVLTNLCELLDCDADYLLGRLDNSTHDLNFICNQTHLEEKTIKDLKHIPMYPHYMNYISKGIIPFCTQNEIESLFTKIEEFMQETEDRASSITLLELQQILTKIKYNINHEEKDPHKRLY